MMRQPIVITGIGVLASNGLGRERFWDAIKNGESGIGRLDRFDASDLPCQIAGQLWDFDPKDFMKASTVRLWNRHVHQAVAGARMAVEDAEFADAGYDGDRVAVCIGTSVGSPDEMYKAEREAYETRGYRKVSRLASSAFAGHAATVHVTVEFGLRGPALTIASGCSTGLDVLAWGASQLRAGKADAALVGATESPIFPLSFASACSLGILTKRNDEPHRAMRPFDRHRDGICLSEGCAALILERADRAKTRGARILGEVAGAGSSAEAHSPLILEQDGKALARAVNAALDDANVDAGDIDHIQCHGVSLEMYDRCESNAYKRVFGERAYRIPISAIKSMTGQAYAAGGLLGVAAALMTLNRGVVPPTINLEDPDPLCDLDYVPNQSRLNDVDTALVTTISFGGTYSASVLRRMN